MVCGLVWGIGLRRLGCGGGRRLVTGSCVLRETTQTGCPWSRPRVSRSIYLSNPNPNPNPSPNQAGAKWHPKNWLQYPAGKPFPKFSPESQA